MASIFDNSPSGVDIPDLREYLSYRSKWPSGMRQTEPRDYPGYGRKIPLPAQKPHYNMDDIYQGVADWFDFHTGGSTDELQVLPTEFAKELLEHRAINGITPEKDRDTIEAWNRFKKEQYQRRGKGGWQVPTEIGSDKPVSFPLSEWAQESSELVNPRLIMAEAKAMEDQGSAEGIELTQQPDVGGASVVQPPKFRGNY